MKIKLTSTSNSLGHLHGRINAAGLKSQETIQEHYEDLMGQGDRNTNSLDSKINQLRNEIAQQKSEYAHEHKEEHEKTNLRRMGEKASD